MVLIPIRSLGDLEDGPYMDVHLLGWERVREVDVRIRVVPTAGQFQSEFCF